MIAWTDITKDIRLIVKSPCKRYVIVRVTDIYERKIYRVLHRAFGEDYKMVFTAGKIEKCIAWLNDYDIHIICNI